MNSEKDKKSVKKLGLPPASPFHIDLFDCFSNTLVNCFRYNI